MKTTTQIFLSYAREDAEKVEDLYQRLSDAGFKPWMDKKDILPGEQWESCIQKAIRRSDFFLMCLSANSTDKRGWIQREIKQALDLWQKKLDSDIYLIPVRLEYCKVPESLCRFQWVNLFEKDGWTRLMQAIQIGIERRKASADGESVRPVPKLASSRRQVNWEMVGAIAGVIGLLIALGTWLVPHVDSPFAKLSKTPTATPTSSPTHTPIIFTATPTNTPSTLTATPTFTASPTPTPVPPTDTPPPVPTGMVHVPAGEFTMGSSDSDPNARDDEKPQHTVYLGAFFIDRTEVTNEQFAGFVREKGYEPRGEGSIWKQGLKLVPTEGVNWRHPQDPYDDWSKKADHPVVQVNWYDARAYCQWLSEKTGEEYRLPTEAEWEKASGWDHEQERKRVWPWGDDPPTGKKLFNYCDVGCQIAPDVTWADTEFDDGVERTAPVGSFSPQGDSPYGVQDMAGNVWEWTADWYEAYPGSSFQSPLYGEEYRVLRGGSWFQGYGDQGRTASRFFATPEARTFDIGFRCVRSVKDSQSE